MAGSDAPRRWRPHRPRERAAEIEALREAAREQFERYARETLCPRLGCGEPGRLRLETPPAGFRSLLFFVDADGLPPLVLRGERLRQLRRRARGHEALGRIGLNVPRVLHLDLRPATLLRHGHGFLAEERLPGEPLREDCAPETAAALGRAFASLHGHTASAVGRVGEIRWPWNRMGRKLRRWTRKRLRRIEARGDPGAAELLRWVASQPPEIFDPTPRLRMGDVTSTNVLVHGGRVGFVDLSGVGYGAAAHEVARLRRRMLFHDDALFAAFFSAYREAAAPDLREEVEAALPLFDRLHDL